MRKSLYHFILIILLLFFGCKKAESKIIKDNKDNSDLTNKNTNLNELIGKLGGGIPKGQFKMIDAEIMNIDGKMIRLSDNKNKIIMLNLWATWCHPCREEMPSMQKLYNDFKNKDFIIIAVSQGENLNTVKKFLKNYNYDFPIFIDKNNEIARSYSTGSIPTTYLISKEGNMIAQFIGGRDWYSKESIDLFNELLK